jgi:hypothetical protein
MKIYKRWFDPLVLHMHDDWKWHGMLKIKIESSKTGRTQESIDVLDFHQFKWFMEGKKQQ